MTVRIGLRISLLVALLALACTGPGDGPDVAPAPPGSEPGQAQISEWQQTVVAARQEGSVAVIVPIGEERRAALAEPFERAYGIHVDTWSEAGPGLGPRLTAEREAGQYLWDVFVGGPTTGFTTLLPMQALDPLEPALMLPDVKDPQHWREGRLEFSDEERTLLAFTAAYRAGLFVNTSQVQPGEITSYQDLLDPKWKGRLLIHDPRIAGPGQAAFTFFYLHPALGPDFIRALGRQEPVLLRETLQLVDAAGQGRYPILIGSSDNIVEERIHQGVPLSIVDPGQLREGTYTTTFNVGLFNHLPHPNAAKAYVNWMLSRDAQAEISRAFADISTRVDVPTDHAPWRVPQPGAIRANSRQALDVRNQLGPLLAEVFGR